MNPVLGNAATSAPNDASFQPMRELRLDPTTKTTVASAHSKYTEAAPKSSSCAIGVLDPNRYSMQGSAK